MTRKIDFHIHTVSSIKDSKFVFSLEWLKKYVETTKLDAIAITNHDLFDKENFEEIKEALEGIMVYPGIELTLDVGHVNIVFPVDCIDELSNFSNWLSEIHQTQSESITSEKLCEQLPCWNKGIYIFELGKSKGVKEIPSVLNSVVHVGGVPNQLRFNIAHKNSETLIPCLFSDAHATDSDTNDRNNIQKLQNKQTYLQIDSCEFEDIKRCLRDRSKISINKDNLQSVINVNGVNISSGLNLVVGKRGTGKTHFLEKIKEEYGENECYEIKQFETARADEYIEKQRKEQGLSALHLWQEKYETQFSKVKDYLNNDATEQENIEGFLDDVKKYANEMAISKSSKKYVLFQESEYELSEIGYLENALVNIKEVIEKTEIWNLLENRIQKKNNFIDVYSELRGVYLKFRQENDIKEKVNEIMDEVKTTLTARTGISNVQQCSINKVIRRIQLEKKINEFLKDIITETSLKNERLHGYQIQVNLVPYELASQFQKEVGTREAVNDDLMEAYKKKEFTTFLNILKGKKFYNEVNLAEYLVRKEVKLLDSDGIPASGGQAVGFALMLRLNEAKNKPIILIDEPESSLDNAYIRNELNKELKQLARNSMVIVITHNSTLGTLLEPDYLIVTSKDNDGNYSIMSGEFSSTKIRDSIKRIEEKSYDKFIEAMESGIESYAKKGEVYATLNS
ncbi:AAA family ATPase [Streptococcus sp. sy004]|uniref:AAA family ATPase n=1 Tax=Streptococcus sp. sy004 TaxID=2600149 RepID=UPI0011B5CC0F|nr:AAA family ATPase [Streptococcus sp. sy004]TWT11318.1 AAA family ATPase [Streptococcus sp. sy004]